LRRKIKVEICDFDPKTQKKAEKNIPHRLSGKLPKCLPQIGRNRQQNGS
jgi:hypothetical protein